MGKINLDFIFIWKFYGCIYNVILFVDVNVLFLEIFVGVGFFYFDDLKENYFSGDLIIGNFIYSFKI